MLERVLDKLLRAKRCEEGMERESRISRGCARWLKFAGSVADSFGVFA